MCFLVGYKQDDQINEDEMGKTCSMFQADESVSSFSLKTQRGETTRGTWACKEES